MNLLYALLKNACELFRFHENCIKSECHEIFNSTELVILGMKTFKSLRKHENPFYRNLKSK